jgi:gliding motility-associated protein GldL
MSSKKVTGQKKFLHIASCVGASIVIVGALFKIQHWPGANIALIAGLGTEAILFLLFATDIPHEDVDWAKAYPELEDPHAVVERPSLKANNSDAVSQKLDQMLNDANIGTDLIESLGQGMRALSEKAGSMAEISDATLATNEYVDSVKSAAKNVSSLSDTYTKAAQSISGISVNGDSSTSFGEELTKASKNLSSLNSVYELQLNGAQDSLKSTSKFYEGLSDLMKNLNDSVEDTKRYKSEISSLSNNLEALNTVYGNMLNAMNFKK